MNVSRARRRLMAQRRYTDRCNGDRYWPMPGYRIAPSSIDGRAALVQVRRLSNNKYRKGISDLVRSGILVDRYDYDCGGWSFSGPPCGGCDRCVADQHLYFLTEWSDRARKANMMIENRTWRQTW